MKRLITVFIIVLYAIFLLIYLIEPVFSCAATSTSSSPTTTTTKITTTTTTTSTTSTTTVAPCATCTIGEVTFTAGTTTPTGTLSTDANGCLVLTVECNGMGVIVFMQFNVNQGGPTNPTGLDVTAVLNCVNGQWVYEPGGGLPSRVITEVNCVGGAG